MAIASKRKTTNPLMAGDELDLHRFRLLVNELLNLMEENEGFNNANSEGVDNRQQFVSPRVPLSGPKKPRLWIDHWLLISCIYSRLVSPSGRKTHANSRVQKPAFAYLKLST